MTSRRPILVAILDGWGIAPPGPGNATTQARTPTMDNFWKTYPHTQLIAHGESVGLPKREPGNTETGHLNIGAGRIVYQDLPRIDMSIADGSFFQNSVFLQAVAHVKQHNSKLHLLGLIGGGGVHSDLKHFFSLIRLCKEQNLSQVFIHAFTDGRDSPPTSSLTHLHQLQEVLNTEKTGQIASISGRYYAMDRDFRWDRIAKTYFCLTQGVGNKAGTVDECVQNSYAQNETDEFIKPTNITNMSGNPLALISDNDAVIFVNFRIDRPRELTKAFVLDNFEKNANIVGFDPYAIEFAHKHEITADTSKQPPFARPQKINNLYFATMTEYEANLPTQVAFPPLGVDDPLGFVISSHGMKQLRICESEKERFVTYYFNGLKEDPYPQETRTIIPSPKVATYDKKPEMSAKEITSVLVQEILSQKYDFIALNYANADMVGHTGNIASTIIGCETIDTCLAELHQAILQVNGVMLITADHGNAEEMIDPITGEKDTEHNANPVPLIAVGNNLPSVQLPQGILADIAPTVLSLLNIPIPFSFTGRNLLSTLSLP